MNRHHDPLEESLNALAAEPVPAMKSMRAEVHARLRHTSHAAPRGIRERLESIFRQPAFAGAFVTACLLLGLFLAELRVSAINQQQTERWIRDYARLIDPRRALPATTTLEAQP